MIAPSRMMTPLSIKPSDQVRKAADTEASSSHALVNLTRLIRSLDNVDPEDSDASNGRILPAEIALRRDWETVQYARVLLDSLRVQNEQSSKTSSTLSTLDQTLNNVEERYIGVLSSQLTTANGIGFGVQTPSLVLLPLSPPPAPVSAVTSHTASIPTPDSTPPFQTGDIPSNTVRHRSIPKDYLTTRLREDVQRGEVGLLPLRTKTASEANARESLLGPPESAGGLGAAQLHEELGGQLADMSLRLKLNALHFASSLNEEKPLVDTSTLVLENNLASTRSSKKDLSVVSRKSRGTTCLTLGVVVFVIVVFVWTYMLIRFT